MKIRAILFLLSFSICLPTRAQSPKYQLIQGSFTWSEANIDAARRGGHLATITSEEEWRTVTGLFGTSLLDAFLGGTDEGQEGVWRWVTGEPWGFTKWHAGQPDNSSGVQNYLWLHPAYGLDWDDADGNSKSRYLLEFEPNPQPPVQIEFVTVADAGNPPDATGYGKVDYVFQIGKFEINNLQYAAFLNAKAKSDPHSLYDPTAVPNNGIFRSGTDGSFSYSVNSGMERKPVTFVNFYKAMRFVNWLNNGGTWQSDTETGAYTFGSDGSLPTRRNPDAKIFLPNENEWYKAAYYQPVERGGPLGGYWLYATRSNSAPKSELPPGGTNSANYTTSVSVTDVGAYVSASSYYGTFDQTGNVWEWNETALKGGRAIRGGGIGEPASKIGSSFRFDNFNDGAGWEQADLGFRVARPFPPPEPPSSPPQPPLINSFTLSRLAYGRIQGFRIPVSPPDRTAFAIETSVDLKTWMPLIKFPSNSGPFEFIDSAATNDTRRFYRAIKY